MKKTLFAALLSLLCASFCASGAAPADSLSAGKDIVKTGWNIGPLPVVAYDADKGLQLGAIIQLFNYGDGSNYPNYNSKWYLEASFFTKGSMLFQFMYDEKELIPGVRWTSAISAAIDQGMDFFGFGGYQSYYDYGSVASGKAGESYVLPGGSVSTALFSPFYKTYRTQILGKTDFVGKITDHFRWEAGYHPSYFKQTSINYGKINKGKSDSQVYPSSEPTLYDYYRKWGLISDDEAEGGFVGALRFGLCYDSRDKEGAPSRGIWAEGHVTAAPKWLGTTNPFYRYSLTFRHYVPIVKADVLTFAYRLNYEGTFGSSAPYYVLPYMTVQGENWDRDGMGGYRTCRGLMRNRSVGLDMATYTAELRWRFVKFRLGKQNIALALNAFSDGTMVTRGRDLSFKYSQAASDYLAQKAIYDKFVRPGDSDAPHITAGLGFRFIMNENFIVAAEYGMPLTHLDKNNSRYNQDGTGAFYLNVGYLF